MSQKQSIKETSQLMYCIFHDLLLNVKNQDLSNDPCHWSHCIVSRPRKLCRQLLQDILGHNAGQDTDVGNKTSGYDQLVGQDPMDRD